jgi:hypothetical protein
MVSIVTVWTRRDQTLGVRRAEMSVLGLCGQAVAITRGTGNGGSHGGPAQGRRAFRGASGGVPAVGDGTGSSRWNNV